MEPETPQTDQPAETPDTETPAPEVPDEEPKGKDALPDWAQRELTEARGEAANYRTKLRDAEAKLSEAKTVEEFETAVAELRAQNEALARTNLVTSVARKFELPDELSELLQGSTQEELEAHAKKLQKFVAPREPHQLTGGLTPDSEGIENLDPRALARKSRRN